MYLIQLEIKRKILGLTRNKFGIKIVILENLEALTERNMQYIQILLFSAETKLFIKVSIFNIFC